MDNDKKSDRTHFTLAAGKPVRLSLARADIVTAQHVEIAIAYLKVMGGTVAAAYMCQVGIPALVAFRVLVDSRQKTCVRHDSESRIDNDIGEMSMGMDE